MEVASFEGERLNVKASRAERALKSHVGSGEFSPDCLSALGIIVISSISTNAYLPDAVLAFCCIIRVMSA